MRIILTVLTLALASCATKTVALDSGCEAMRPYMPIKFHGSDDTASTINQVRNANAAFRGACP